MRWNLFFGRLLFGGSFLWVAAQNMLHAKAITDALAAHSIPYPEFAMVVSTLLLTLGGLSVVLGFMPRIGLGLIILFLIPATFIMHAFWSADAAISGNDLAMLAMNVALIGAALSLLALPAPWPLSVDQWLRDRGGFSGENALARGWRRLVQSARQVAQPGRTRAHSQSAAIVPNESVVPAANGRWIVRQQAVRSSDGSFAMRVVRAYYSS